MLNKITVFVLASSLSSFSLACSKPDQPLLPTADSAVLAQMVKAQKEVNKYLKQSEKYLKCARSTKLQNNMVDEMKLVGNNYNKLVQNYKARS